MSDVYYLIQSGAMLDAVRQYIVDKLRVTDENKAIASELGVTNGNINMIGALSGVVFPKEIHPDFTARHKKTKLSYPRKGSAWEKRLQANTMPSQYEVISRVVDIPLSVNYEAIDGSSSGMTSIGNPLNECGFLYLSENGPFVFWAPDAEAAIAQKESEGYKVTHPATPYKLNPEGCLKITEDQWNLMVSQHKAGLPITIPGEEGLSFQARVKPWMEACFTPEVVTDPVERNHRFIEEALELAQACGASAEEMHNLVEYVFNRPVGEKTQEVGGVAVTLAALCNAQGIDIEKSQETELARIWTCVQKIRDKQALKPDFRKGPSL